MTRDILLARRLLEAVADPDASVAEADGAGIELAELSARLDLPAGRLFSGATFDGLKPQDLSPAAWLLLLETRRDGDPEVPPDILEALFLDYSDVTIRFRLVQGALAQPDVRRRHSEISGVAAVTLGALPQSWPKQRLQMLEALAETDDGASAAADALLEMTLYLFQDGSEVALDLAAAAVVEDDANWRQVARAVAMQMVRAVDPDLAGYGRRFRPVGT